MQFHKVTYRHYIHTCEGSTHLHLPTHKTVKEMNTTRRTRNTPFDKLCVSMRVYTPCVNEDDSPIGGLSHSDRDNTSPHALDNRGFRR